MTERAGEEQLLTLIENRRRYINIYLTRARSRAQRLTLTSIISSSLAAAFTAGPALGGPPFTLALANSLSLDGAAAVWRPLCLLAMIVSVVAAITATLSKSGNAELGISNAEACNTELHLLSTFLEFDQIPLKEALKMYQESVSKIPFIPDSDVGLRNVIGHELSRPRERP